MENYSNQQSRYPLILSAFAVIFQKKLITLEAAIFFKKAKVLQVLKF